MSCSERRTVIAACVAMACAPRARAALGEPAAAVQGEQLRLGASRRVLQTLGLEIHELTLTDGSRIREFALPGGGPVVAVAWRAHFKPRLDELLGRYFPEYVDSVKALRAQRPGLLRHAQLRTAQLAVEQHEHLQLHEGRAWLVQRLPAGFAADALR